MLVIRFSLFHRGKKERRAAVFPDFIGRIWRYGFGSFFFRSMESMPTTTSAAPTSTTLVYRKSVFSHNSFDEIDENQRKRT